MSERNKTILPSKNSKALRDLRISSGVSIRKLAERLDLSPTRVNQMELGRDNIHDEYIEKFLAALDISRLEWDTVVSSEKIPFLELQKSCIALIRNLNQYQLESVQKYLQKMSPTYLKEHTGSSEKRL